MNKLKLISKKTGEVRFATLMSECSLQAYNIWRVKQKDGSTRPMFQKDVARRWDMVVEA